MVRRIGGIRILVVTGVSGVGKTAAVESLESRGRHGVFCHYLDRMGIPSDDVMAREYGGGNQWQAWATEWWIGRLASAEDDPGVVHVLDAQTRPSFVRDALERIGVDASSVQIALLVCDPAVRRQRLTERGHGELASARTDDWAAHLRQQADELGLPVIDTTSLDTNGVADALEAEVENLRRERR